MHMWVCVEVESQLKLDLAEGEFGPIAERFPCWISHFPAGQRAGESSYRKLPVSVLLFFFFFFFLQLQLELLLACLR